MRHQDLRRPRGIERLWLRLRLTLTRARPRLGDPVIGDLSRLSDCQLRDIGLERREAASTVSFWRIDG